MKRLYIIVALAFSAPTFAQTDADALRYSMLDFGGTARALGSANAYGAVGGDFSSVSINPAGLGIYRSSELILSPGLANIKASANFFGTGTEENKYDFYLGNASLVFSSIGDKEKSDGWVGGNFGIGYNKLANFNSEVYYTGFNNASSLLDVYANRLNGINPSDAFSADPFGAGLAWETYLLNPNPDDSTTYFGVVNGGNVQQSKYISTKGGLNEMAISFAGNYANKIYIGGTIGVPFINYDNITTYSEEDVNAVHNDFVNFAQTDVLSTDGVGINIKLGMIYRLNDIIRLGAAVHSPTLFQMNDVYYSTMESSLDASGEYSYDSPLGEYDYELVTPWRVIGSAAFTFKKAGLLSVDYEFVDYSEANFNYGYGLNSLAENEAETAVNNSIDAKYGTASNIRIGGEIAYEVFRFRAGYAIIGSPFQDGVATGDADLSKNTYSAGIGIKGESVFLDLGYSHSTSTEYDIQYLNVNPDIPNNGSTIDKGVNNFQVSLGFRF
ncbi:MAG: OmpP1/FadL family transporter [Chitinophagales bacterium]